MSDPHVATTLVFALAWCGSIGLLAAVAAIAARIRARRARLAARHAWKR